MRSDTPRTDAIARNNVRLATIDGAVPIEFAKQIERELNVCMEALRKEAQYNRCLAMLCNLLEDVRRTFERKYLKKI